MNWGLEGCARWRKVTITFTLNRVAEYCSKELKKLLNKIELKLGWLRAVAQGYRYSCSKLELWSIFQRNLMSW